MLVGLMNNVPVGFDEPNRQWWRSEATGIGYETGGGNPKQDPSATASGGGQRVHTNARGFHREIGRPPP